MPKTKISEYSTTNSDNTDIESINIAEGCAPSGINNAIRELMVHLKEFQTGASGDAFTFAGGVLISGTANTITGNVLMSGTNTITGSTTATFAAGAVGTPSIAAHGDTNTGIFFPAADTIAFAEGGAEAMRIDSSGNVGIGTTAPSSALEVYLADTTYVRARENLTNKTVGYQIVANGGTPTAVFSSNTATGEVRLGGIATNYFQTFYTSNSERMRIDSSGNVGIGTTSPAYKLDVDRASVGIVARFKGGTRSAHIYSDNDAVYFTSDTGVATAFGCNETSDLLTFYTGNTERARITSGGELLVATTNTGTAMIYTEAPASKHAIRGNAQTAAYVGVYGTHSSNLANGYAAYFNNTGSNTGLYISNTAAWQSISDSRLKKDVQDLDTTARLMQLRPVDYLWKNQEESDEPTKRNFGFIAQEVQQVFPELVSVSPNEMLGVEYTGLIAPLVKAIQELKAITDAQATRIEALEAEVAAMKAGNGN